MYELIKKGNKIYCLKIITLSCFVFFCLFLFETKTTKASLSSAECASKGGSCDVTCWSSDYESLGMCDYGVLNCCRKKLVDLAGDPDPKGKGNFAAGSCGSSGEGTCKFFAAIGGTICGNDENIGQSTCSWSQVCCVPKANNVGVDPTNPATANPTTGASPTAPGAASPGGGGSPATASGARTGSTGGLVPCTDDCTLCHLVLGFKNIYDYLLVLLLSATTLVVVAAGVMYMVSSGDKGMIDKAKSALTYAITAMILALTAWLIINATLSALGYTKVGSWYNFTCDTAQTQGPTGGVGTGTLPGNTGGGAGSYKASEYLSPKAQEVINNYMNTQVGKNYGGDVHCYSTTDAAYTLSGLSDLGGRWKVWDGKETINPGDAMQTSKHTWLVLENGATSNAIPGGKIGVNPDGLNYNLNKAKNLGLQVKIIHVN